MMAEQRNCPKCGTELPANAPRGLCPKCLMKAGMQVGSEVKQGGSSEISHGVPTSATPPGGFVPPEPEEPRQSPGREVESSCAPQAPLLIHTL